ncbi:hypothetical protein [Companilactobacillus metriopterae]|uniref:hypothetical protein n=1 Tax=Companilactobacillus metriopterae TaxID=1909267 RepID=UPI00100B8628|nr:hypothetical protein [Companilactobacillus metriopterae]
MEYLKKRIRFILIFIFSIIVLFFVHYEMAKRPEFANSTRMIWTTNLLNIFCGGFALYSVVQFFRVK